MLKFLSEGQCLRGTGLDTQAAEGAHSEMINVLIYNSLFLSFLVYYGSRDDLNGTVGTVDLTDTAACAFMLVVFIMRHYNLTFEHVKHLQLLAVVRILLGPGSSGLEEIFACDTHSLQKGDKPVNNALYISDKTFH